MKKLMLTALLALGGLAAMVTSADAARVVTKRDRYELPVYVVKSSRAGPVSRSCLPPCPTSYPPARVVVWYSGWHGYHGYGR
jgi:hypothetical protein